MAKHRKPSKNHVNPLLGGAVLAGGMLIGLPAAIAAATPINGRPALAHDAPGVEKVQTAGDKFFDNHPYADDSGAGSLYHAVFGRSAKSNQAATNNPKATGTNGLYAGVRNTYPRVIKCNPVVQTGC